MSNEGEPAATGFPSNAVHLMRTNQQLTMQLSQMADQKASILMGATFVVFTISVGQLRSGAMAVPLAVLATFAFLSAVLAISAVMPRFGSMPAEGDAEGDTRRNLLFFGHFSAMSEEAFIAAVKARSRSEEDMYDMMLRDTYQNGVVLARRKYRYLGYAYRLFVVGLTLTFIAFVIELAVGWARLV
ncbi:Pycsar system effector family protein [Sphingopyxis indica]|uniref:Pycsar effector protein domain-containing protein n=1 Tax=Sphingopyxis indica TaxID=436663 RepID=A0A239GB89_9SPHN|nr:Pycsar system effector family protein [Sphingopyxis indica]WOF44108.1 hypothetical protein KNJ79_03950 [Sphingopyxis indica]SNS66185.1 hypothetical protein SAMN06295955_103103 [Sphingopyxis indica]